MKGKRGRAVVLWMAGTYLAAQLMTGLLMDYVWPQVRFPSAHHIFAMLAQWPPQGPEVVCLGSSRMGCAFQANVVTQCLRQETGDSEVAAVNWSVPACELVASDYLLTELLKRGARPKLLVLEIVPDCLHRRMPWLQMVAMRQWTWTDFPVYFFECCRTGQVVRLLSSRFQPLYAHRQLLWKQAWDWLAGPEPAAPANNQNRVLATAPEQFGGPVAEAPIGADRMATLSISMPALARQLRNYQIGSRGSGLLEHIYLQCRQHDIELLLVMPPVASTHRAVYQPDIDPIFLAFLKEFCARPGISFHDCRAAVPDPLFVDHHHMTEAGGTCFSRQLTQQVLTPALQRLRAVPDTVARQD